MSTRTTKTMLAGWINLTTDCNNRCHHCFRAEDCGLSPRHMNYETAKAAVDYFNELGIADCAFIGGEPTLYPEFEKIVNYAQKSGIQNIHLVTNARVLSDKVLARSIAKNIDYCGVTLFSSDPQIHNTIAQAEAFNESVAGIKNMLSYGCKITVNIVVSNRNLSYIDEVVDYTLRLKVNEILLTSAKPRYYNGHIDGNEALHPRDFAPVVERLKNKLINFHIKRPFCLFNIETIQNLAVQYRLRVKCDIAASNCITLDVDGQILPCNSVVRPMVKLIDDGRRLIPLNELRGVLQEQKRRIRNSFLQRKPNACKGCTFWEFCGGGCPLAWKAFHLEKEVGWQ